VVVDGASFEYPDEVALFPSRWRFCPNGGPERAVTSDMCKCLALGRPPRDQIQPSCGRPADNTTRAARAPIRQQQGRNRHGQGRRRAPWGAACRAEVQRGPNPLAVGDDRGGADSWARRPGTKMQPAEIAAQQGGAETKIHRLGRQAGAGR